MLKRPLNPQFSDAVLEGRKFTTIREAPWPIGKSIMLYHWGGKPYRSKQVDVAVVKVLGFWIIRITRNDDDSMSYEYGMENAKSLHETEGFDSADAMDAWFRPLVRPGQTVEKALIRFALLKGTRKWCRWTVFRDGRERQCEGLPGKSGFCASHVHLADDFDGEPTSAKNFESR